MIFLTAKWKNLLLLNYEVNPEILKSYIPNGTQIDFYKNKCYISLVGFMFKNTKVLGMQLPYHINFEEVNLRFYVKYNDKRGVVFIKEIVPKPLITAIANSIYKEHYETSKMSHIWKKENKSNYIEYTWKKDNKVQSISVLTEIEPIKIKPNSIEDFITEHYFGYTKNENKTFEYEVQHPSWLHYPVIDYKLNIDFRKNYGKDFSFLNHLQPNSIILAKGSKISVKNKKTVVK